MGIQSYTSIIVAITILLAIATIHNHFNDED